MRPANAVSAPTTWPCRTARWLLSLDRAILRPRLGIWYASRSYLRWVDGIADRNNWRLDETLAFLNRQYNVVSGSIRPSTEHEQLGRLLGLAKAPGGARLRRLVLSLIESFASDAEARGHLRSAENLKNRSAKIGGAVLQIAECAFASPGTVSPEMRQDIARLYIGIDNVLDLEEDINNLDLRISDEDADTHGISHLLLSGDWKSLRSHPGLIAWRANEISSLIELADVVGPRVQGLRGRILRKVLEHETERRIRKIVAKSGLNGGSR